MPILVMDFGWYPKLEPDSVPIGSRPLSILYLRMHDELC